MEWIELIVHTTTEGTDQVSELLMDAGASGTIPHRDCRMKDVLSIAVFRKDFPISPSSYPVKLEPSTLSMMSCI